MGTFHLSNLRRNKVYQFQYPCGEEKTYCAPLVGTFPRGLFLLEVYGAEGGTSENKDLQNAHGGTGGYSRGIIYISNPIQAFLTIGARGVNADETTKYSKITFGGGGSCRQSFDRSDPASSGGGASDIRFIENDLYHRVIVAGGGGGSAFYMGKYRQGGSGGGFEGGTSLVTTGPVADDNFAGKGATQENGASFGFGGNATEWDGCGGGGGWVSFSLMKHKALQVKLIWHYLPFFICILHQQTYLTTMVMD